MYKSFLTSMMHNNENDEVKHRQLLKKIVKRICISLFSLYKLNIPRLHDLKQEQTKYSYTNIKTK